MSVARISSLSLALLAGVASAAPQGAPPLSKPPRTATESPSPAARSGRRRRRARRRRHDGAALGRARRPPRDRSLLLDSGADASAADRYGVTPLYLAAENGNAAVIAALLDAGADVNAVAPTGETALMTATRTGLIDAVALLLDRGAAVDARDPRVRADGADARRARRPIPTWWRC